MISDSKIEYLDNAFLGTMESQGFKNAKLAIKHILFDDEQVALKKVEDKDKWSFISTRYNGRENAKKLHHLDLMHILVKFCYSYFGLKNEKFKLSENDHNELKTSLFPSMALTTEELVEYIVHNALQSVEDAYVTLSIHKDIVMNLVDLLITTRYLDKQKEELDNFKSINYPKMKIKEYEHFIDRYKALDIEFSLLKRKDPSYQN